MNKELGEKLRSMRINSGLTANDILKRLKRQHQNYSLQSVYKWEKGVAIPKINVLVALSNIYKCDVSYLMDEKNLTYKNLTPSEIFLLKEYRNDFLFRSIAVQIMRHIG